MYLLSLLFVYLYELVGLDGVMNYYVLGSQIIFLFCLCHVLNSYIHCVLHLHILINLILTRLPYQTIERMC